MHQKAWAVPAPTTLSFKMSAGGSTVIVARKSGGDPNSGYKVSINETAARDAQSGLPTGKTMHKPIIISGRDAQIGSLLYPVVVLAHGAAAAPGVLQALGYQVTVKDDPATDCQQVFSAQRCTDLASQLSESIDATLALGDAPERAAFLSGIQALGFAPCQTITTITTTSSTTSTTICPTGRTNCSGTCVDLTRDPNNCGSCGTVCPPVTPACIGSVCTIP